MTRVRRRGSLAGGIVMLTTAMAAVAVVVTGLFAWQIIRTSAEAQEHDRLSRQAEALARTPPLATWMLDRQRIAGGENIRLALVRPAGAVDGPAAAVVDAGRRGALLAGRSVSGTARLDGHEVLVEGAPTPAGGGLVVAMGGGVGTLHELTAALYYATTIRSLPVRLLGPTACRLSTFLRGAEGWLTESPTRPLVLRALVRDPDGARCGSRGTRSRLPAYARLRRRPNAGESPLCCLTGVVMCVTFGSRPRLELTGTESGNWLACICRPEIAFIGVDLPAYSPDLVQNRTPDRFRAMGKDTALRVLIHSSQDAKTQTTQPARSNRRATAHH